MSYPSVTFTEMLSNATRAELEFFASLLQGYLSQEHNEDGEHTDISAESIEVEDGVEVGGDLTVTGDADIDGVHIGAAGNSGNGMIGVRLRTAATGTNLIRRFDLVSDIASIIGARMLAYDASGDRDMGGWRWNNGRTAYEFMPDPTTKADRTVSLGSPTDGSQGGWWHDGYIDALYLGHYGTTAAGRWATVAYNAANFTADSGNWTVDDADEVVSVIRIDDTMIVSFNIIASDISATPAELRIAIPGGLNAVRRADTTCLIVNAGGVTEVGQVRVSAGEAVIKINRIAGAGNFSTTAADNTTVVGQIAFEV